jgi:hypothetical protein
MTKNRRTLGAIATGAATVIKGLGTVPTTFPATDSYFRYLSGGTVLIGA